MIRFLARRSQLKSQISRRHAVGALSAAAVFPLTAAASEKSPFRREVPEAPKICLELGGGGLSAGHFDEAGMRRVKQLGVDHVAMGGPPLPWEESQLRAMLERAKSGGLTIGNMMIGGFP